MQKHPYTNALLAEGLEATAHIPERAPVDHLWEWRRDVESYLAQQAAPANTTEGTNCLHLGDGVYADFDGYHIRLRANDHRSDPVIFLDAQVMAALISYYTKLNTEPDVVLHIGGEDVIEPGMAETRRRVLDLFVDKNG